MNPPLQTTDNKLPTNQDSCRILVTGGAGFIGSHIADALIAKGHKVAVVDNLSTGTKKNINKDAEFFEVDITDKNKLKEVFKKVKPEAVFHLAAQASVNDSIARPAEDIETNVIGTVNLLELARDFGAKKFIFSSTGGAIYGDKAERPTPETAEEHPLTPYGMDKLAAEKYIEFFASNYGLKPVILRYANVYGPRQNPHGEAGVVAIFTSRIHEGKPYDLYGDGEQTRDFVYVADVVAANLSAYEFDGTGTFNIGLGQETSINKVIELLMKYSNSEISPTHQPARVEQRNSCLDSSLAQKTLGWKPSASIEEGLEETVEWYKKEV